MPTSQPCWGRKEHSSSFQDHDHIHTSAAAPRSTDVHAPAQRSQLFPLPSWLLYWLRLWHIQQCFKIFFFLKKPFESRHFNPSCFFFFWCIIYPNFLVVTKFTHTIKLQSLKHPFPSYAKLWFTEVSVQHLTTSRVSSQFSIVNNLKGCLKGWGRGETVAAVLCFFQRPAKCAWLCGKKGNNFLKKWWSYCVEHSFPCFAWGQFLFYPF